MGEQLLLNLHYQAFENQGWENNVSKRRSRLEFYSKQKMVNLCELEPNLGKVAIVGGAPSIAFYQRHIRKIKEDGGLIMSINGAHAWLIGHDITPHIHVVYEIDLEKVEDTTRGPPHKDVIYYLCSHTNPDISHQLDGYKKVLWHAYDDDNQYLKDLAELFPRTLIVAGGYVTFFRCLNIATILGFRDIEFFGCDASFEGGNSHYDGYYKENNEKDFMVAAGTRDNFKMFKTIPSLSFLAHEFMRYCEANEGMKLKVHGNGLMNHLHKMEYPHQYLDNQDSVVINK